MYYSRNKYVPGNNYVLENGSTFKYNGRRFDSSGKYIGDSFTSTCRDNPTHKIYTNYDSKNDPNINRTHIKEAVDQYGRGKSYNTKRSVNSERNRLNNIVRREQKQQKDRKMENSRKLENLSIASKPTKKKNNGPIKNRLYGS